MVLMLKRSQVKSSEDYHKKFDQMQNLMSNFENLQNNDEHLICPICFDYLIGSTSTICGHTFCEKCLSESMLISSHCPICRAQIRTFQPCFSKTIDKFVRSYVEIKETKEIQAQFKIRVTEYNDWKKSLKIQPDEIAQGNFLDVRDTEFIWCVGQVREKIIHPNKKSVSLLIHYQGWNKLYDEFIDVNSTRLSPLGVYTNRTDIPKYMIQNEDALFSYVIVGNNTPSTAQMLMAAASSPQSSYTNSSSMYSPMSQQNIILNSPGTAAEINHNNRIVNQIQHNHRHYHNFNFNHMINQNDNILDGRSNQNLQNLNINQQQVQDFANLISVENLQIQINLEHHHSTVDQQQQQNNLLDDLENQSNSSEINQMIEQLAQGYLPQNGNEQDYIVDECS